MRNKLFPVILLFLNSQVFFVTAANPLGLRWAQEVFLAFLLLYTAGYVVHHVSHTGKLAYTDLIVLVIVLIYMGGSAVFAYMQYGQPLIYGLIESRVTLAVLIYFPIKRILMSSNVSEIFLLKSIVLITFGIVVFGVLLKVGIIPHSILISPVDVGKDTLRADRNSMGRFYIILSYIIALVMLYHSRKFYWSGLLLLFLYAAFFIVQERQTMIAFVLMTPIYFIYKMKKKSNIKASIIIMILVVGAILLFANSFDAQREKIVLLLGNNLFNSLKDSVRLHTIQTIIDQISIGYGQGHGALSLLWHNGFHRLYGPNFYLGDVGIFGTIFRLGIVALPTLLLVIYMLYKVHKSMRSTPLKEIVALGYLYAVFTLPTSGLIEYRGHFIGLLLAVAASQRVTQNRYTQVSSTTKLSTAHYR